jgi:hypothetical protein
MPLSPIFTSKKAGHMPCTSTVTCALFLGLVAMAQPVQGASFGDLLPKAVQTKPAEAATATTTNTLTSNAIAEVANSDFASSDLAKVDLVTNLMSQLDLNQNQAQGGLGSLLTLAKGKLGQQDFASLSQIIPNMDTLLAAAPSLKKSSGMSGLFSKVGGDLGSSLQGGAMVYSSFEKLGIPKELLAPMVEIAKSYIDAQGTGTNSALLMKGLGALQL